MMGPLATNEVLSLIGTLGATLLLIALAWAIARRVLMRRKPGDRSYMAALEAIALGDHPSAIKHLRTAVEEDTDNVGAYLHLGRLLREKGDHDRALRIHRELTVRALNPTTRKRVLVEVLDDLVAAGRWKDAREVANEVRQMGPPDTGLLSTIGRIHENLREWEDALKTFEELEKRRREPSKRRLALYRAFVARDYEERGKLEKAKRHYEAALRVDPSLTGALLHLGEIHRKNGAIDRAIDAWKSLIRNNPNTVSLVFDRLEKATFQKNPAEITQLVAEYERILAENPNDVSTMRALASIHRRRGDLEEASRIVETALELQPENPRLRRMRARLILESGRPEEAFEELRKLLVSDGAFGRSGFTCSHCGYFAKEYLWRCPACQSWESFEE